MGTQIFLGKPPQYVIDWIESHSKPAGHAETRFTLQDETVETHNITGTLDKQQMIDNGYYDVNSGEWTKTITQVDIGNTVTSIGAMVFMGCSGLTNVTIGNGVTSIRSVAFAGCSSLTNVTIPDSVTSIGSSAFAGCSSLTNVTIPDSMTSIDSYAFEGCSGLMSVEFEGNAPTVETDAFANVAAGCKAVISSTATRFPAAGETWNGLIVEVKS